MVSPLKNEYRERAQLFTGVSGSLKKKLLYTSVFRLLSFIVMFAGIFFIIQYSLFFGISVFFVFLVLFLLLVKQHVRLTEKKEFTDILIRINEDEILSLDHVYSQFADGAEFMDHQHPFSFDLDIFGDGSIFQYINRSSTLHGKKTLAQWLSSVLTRHDQILARQEAVKELAQKTDLRQNFQANGKAFQDKENIYEEVKLWLSQPESFKKKLFSVLAVIFPVLSAISIGFTIIDFSFNPLIILVFLTQLAFVGSQIRKVNSIHIVLEKKVDFLKRTGKLLSIIENEHFTSKKLKELKEQLTFHQTSAHRSIKEFSSLVSSFDYRLNLIVAFILNGFLLWDIQCVLRLEKWKRINRDFLLSWFETAGEFDAYCSFANFSHNHPDFCFPVPSDEIIMDFTNAGHPLIPSPERVGNNMNIQKISDFIIVTGANMAGKSTFLRTVGINLVLAANGAPVCAGEFRFRPMPVFTSMRTTDSLTKNESYFYAELKRLKEVIEELRSGKELFIILDEILKGTNSTDKQKGSRAVLEQIIKLKGTGLIATHDLDLARMEDDFPDHIKNKCFEIEINGTEIFFDYKLYDGITKKMNASLLMKQMGILL